MMSAMQAENSSAIQLLGPGDHEVFRSALSAALEGYGHPDEIAEQIRRDSFSMVLLPEERVGLTDARRVELVRLALAWKRADEAAWTAVTDNDRLHTAFSTLESRGLVCRENFLCCSSCAGAEMHYLIASMQDEGMSPRGYVFFHEQDLANACYGGEPLTIVCGPADWKAPGANDIGREVRQALEEAGLSVEESYVSETPIKLLDVKMVWRKRMLGQ